MHEIHLNQDKQLVAEQKIRYRGTVSVGLDKLTFPYRESRELDYRNVHRLEAKFRKEGYNPLPLQNHIVAEIDQQSLDRSLAASGLSEENLLEFSLGDYPTLELTTGYRLKCLRGQHRVAAAARLGASQWAVDLYLGDLNDDLRNSLIEEYSAEKQPDDGELYRKIRHYQGYEGLHNGYFEARWWARIYAISKTKGDNMKQILRSRKFTSAFDIQVDVPALSEGMMLGTIHKIFALKCDEEVLNYLQYVKEVWFSKIFKQDQHAIKRMDRATVQALDTTAPGAIRGDRERLQTLLNAGKIFGAFTESERRVIWKNILAITRHRSIPSFHSFFRDAHHLKGPADCIKQLITLTPRDTIRTALEASFQDNSQYNDRCIVQESEYEYVSIPGDRSVRRDLGIHHMWLWAFRNHLKMPPQPRQQKGFMSRPEMKRSIRAVHDFALHAYRLGFESEQIHGELERNPDEQIARSGFLEARDPQWHDYRSPTLDLMVKQVAQLYATARKRACPKDVGTKAYEVHPEGQKKHGIEENMDETSSFFLRHFADADARPGGRDDMTSLFVRKSAYCAFFGNPCTMSLDDKHALDVALSFGRQFRGTNQQPHAEYVSKSKELHIQESSEAGDITQELEHCRSQIAIQHHKLEQQRCELQEQSQALKLYSTQLSEQKKSLEERDKQQAHVDEQWRQAQRLQLSVKEQQEHIKNEWDTVKEERRKLKQQASSLQEEERVFRKQQQTVYDSVARCATLEEELNDLRGKFDLIHEKWRIAQESHLRMESELHDLQKQHVRVDEYQREVQKRSNDSNGQKGSLYDDTQSGELLAEYDEAEVLSKSDSVGGHQENTVRAHGSSSLSIISKDREPILRGSTEGNQDVDESFVEVSPEILGPTIDPSVRYTKFDFSNALIQTTQDDQILPKNKDSSEHSPQDVEWVAVNGSASSPNTENISSPLEFHLEIRGDDGNYRLSQIMHADVSGIEAVRRMVVKHLRKGTPMIMQNENGQTVNAENFHIGMSTKEVNIIRFVPHRLVLSEDSHAKPIKDSDVTNQRVRRKPNGT